ncbi:TetR/AcrR family transcriptional regulator [Roseicyclus mahoneyensis]|uniref:TetR family transcriptional regulator n=1 Tax=Roseicyclus mahoneyensis TaxID=164332 RepID=A0A316GRT4_9RHOB|nr:TetR/AcrR family transcriptional regulator [Roseicyclus mahoneyensis]PWK62772.1 TetR family transcriptional regulator [Roseicyclus mahoneyensis]
MTNLNKPDLLIAMAAHVRGTGLAGASLRPLARAAGTSDRMLIYHFGSKGALIAALLEHLSAEMLSAMAAALPRPRAPSEAAALAEIVALLRTPTFRPYLRVWLDILSGAGWGDADHIAAARRILVGQIDWIITRLPETLEQPKPRAKEMLGLIHGALVLEVAGMTKAADLMLARAYPKG